METTDLGAYHYFVEKLRDSEIMDVTHGGSPTRETRRAGARQGAPGARRESGGAQSQR